tara:strand:- start:459 stop:1172 length:714 start_codon:yes stop_codon:yes gene_type:complete
MARISTYPLDTNLVGTDYWIGSDANSSYATKNFTIASVAEYMNREATQQQSIRFAYSNTVPVAAGSLSFDPQGADTVLFSGITTFKLSKYNLVEINTNISGFYQTALIGADILITQSDDPAIWGVFTWNSATVDGSGNFYNVGLTHKNSQNGLTVNKDYFISLLTYPGTSDANYVYTLSGATSYTVTHGLNKFPSVTVFNGTQAVPGVEVYCDVSFVDANIVTLTFVNTFTGVVTFN